MFRRKEIEKTRLPPDQRWIDHILGWGTEHRGLQPILPKITPEEWSLKVGGLIQKPKEYTWNDLLALPQVESVSDFHCVETWSVKDQKWSGVRFNTIMDEAEPKKKAGYVHFKAYDGYTTSLPLEELTGNDILLAHRLNDLSLPQPLGGPVRLVVPHKYAYKSIMWINEAWFSERDKLGYWESESYHNNADPWQRQRYI